MIDIDELREAIQTFGSQAIDEGDLNELLDRLEAAEEEIESWKGLAKQFGNEDDALRAKIEAMENQEPVATVRINAINGNPSVDFVPGHPYLHHNDKLYLAPGAQPAQSTEYVGWYCAHCERGVDASEVTYHEQHQVCGRIITDDKPPKPAPSVPDGWKEAAIAWEVCASIHREYGKGKDPFFNTRQGDFVKHANDARAMLAAAPKLEGE